MKFLHLSDLHIGKTVGGFSMIEEQKHILDRILDIADREDPDGVLIAGDVYDRSIPSVEAVELFDDFISELADRSLQVFIIPGNHDSSGRLAFASGIMSRSGIYIAGSYDGECRRVDVTGRDGVKVKVHMLPFIRPAHVRNALKEEHIEDYTAAVKAAVDRMELNCGEINLLLAHQFVTGASTSGSEELSVGGLENVDASILDEFDYVALGHIHRAQNIGEKIRCCGTPLKYSFSEAGDSKSVTIVDIGGKGDITVRTEELKPLRDMLEIKGSYDELTLKSFYDGEEFRDAYLHIILTDENEIPDAMARLRVIYRNVMKLSYERLAGSNAPEVPEVESAEEFSPGAIFDWFYESVYGRPMSEWQAEHMKQMIEKIWEDEL